jgi:hypothetical protein
MLESALLQKIANTCAIVAGMLTILVIGSLGNSAQLSACGGIGWFYRIPVSVIETFDWTILLSVVTSATIWLLSGQTTKTVTIGAFMIAAWVFLPCNVTGAHLSNLLIITGTIVFALVGGKFALRITKERHNATA